MKRSGIARLACVGLALICTDVSSAQRRGGAHLVAPAVPDAARPTAGTVERVMVRGKALEGNPDGNSPERAVTVYLPVTPPTRSGAFRRSICFTARAAARPRSSISRSPSSRAPIVLPPPRASASSSS